MGEEDAKVVTGTPSSIKCLVERDRVDVTEVTAMIVHRADRFRQVGDVLLRLVESSILLRSVVGVGCLACIQGIYSRVADYLVS